MKTWTWDDAQKWARETVDRLVRKLCEEVAHPENDVWIGLDGEVNSMSPEERDLVARLDIHVE